MVSVLGWVGLVDAQSRLILITDIFIGFVFSWVHTGWDPTAWGLNPGSTTCPL